MINALLFQQFTVPLHIIYKYGHEKNQNWNVGPYLPVDG